MGHDATTGFSSLRDTIISRTRGLSLVGGAEAPAAEGSSSAAAGSKGTDTTAEAGTKELTTDEALRESENVLSRLKVAAAQRLKDIQKAEDAADEALLKFGTNIRDFLRESISIAGPSVDAASGSARGGPSGDGVLFESKDAQGKRVIHTSRFDAQLHVIHTNPESFSKDPASEEYAAWSSSFDIDKKTADITADLTKYPELRTTMEKLVPDQIPYPDFWKRYYFLRHSIETAEARRRDLLKGKLAGRHIPMSHTSVEPSFSLFLLLHFELTASGVSQLHPPRRRLDGMRTLRMTTMRRRVLVKTTLTTRPPLQLDHPSQQWRPRQQPRGRRCPQRPPRSGPDRPIPRRRFNRRRSRQSRLCDPHSRPPPSTASLMSLMSNRRPTARLAMTSWAQLRAYLARRPTAPRTKRVKRATRRTGSEPDVGVTGSDFILFQ